MCHAPLPGSVLISILALLTVLKKASRFMAVKKPSQYFAAAFQGTEKGTPPFPAECLLSIN